MFTGGNLLLQELQGLFQTYFMKGRKLHGNYNHCCSYLYYLQGNKW